MLLTYNGQKVNWSSRDLRDYIKGKRTSVAYSTNALIKRRPASFHLIKRERELLRIARIIGLYREYDRIAAEAGVPDFSSP